MNSVQHLGTLNTFVNKIQTGLGFFLLTIKIIMLSRIEIDLMNIVYMHTFFITAKRIIGVFWGFLI